MPKRIRLGLCSATRGASASAAGPPSRTSRYAVSVAACSRVAPWAPSSPAAAAASGEKATASTVSPSERALVTSSSVAGVGLPPSSSAKTQTVPATSDHLLLSQEVGDALGRVALVADHLAGGALRGRRHRGDGLAGAGAAHTRHLEIRGGEPVERLGLGAHDAL